MLLLPNAKNTTTVEEGLIVKITNDDLNQSQLFVKDEEGHLHSVGTTTMGKGQQADTAITDSDRKVVFAFVERHGTVIVTKASTKQIEERYGPAKPRMKKGSMRPAWKSSYGP